MSNAKVAPMPPSGGDRIPMLPQEGQISVAALEAAMPKKVAQALHGKVDLNRNGYLDAAEIGELFEDLQQSEESRKFMTVGLVVAVVFLGLSILANLGTAWYAAEAHQTTSTNSHGDSSAASSSTTLLTDKSGTPIRVDRSLDEHPMGSLLPDSAFQSLEYLAITGPKGSLRMKVEATARFELLTAQYNSVVVVYTSLGSVEFDGANMLMTDLTADAFHRAGFKTKKSRRSDSSNPHQRFARDVSKITGMFGALTKLELSEFSKATTNANGDPIIPFMNNVFANITEAYIQEDHFIKCMGLNSQSTTDCSGGVVGESLFEFEDAEGNTNTYLKRTKHMVSKLIEGKMMTYAETTVAEYPDAKLVDLTGEGSKISNSYVLTGTCEHVGRDIMACTNTSTMERAQTAYYCDMDTNVTMQEPALPLPAGDNIPAVRKNDGKHVLTYAGNELFFGTEARKYWVHNAGTDPWAAGAERFAVYEHAVESRPFAIAVTPLFQKTWVHIGAASTAPDAFLARAAAHTSKATAAEFLAGPQDCGRYELEPVAKILTNTTMAAVSAPAPLSFFRAAMITPADFQYLHEGIARDRYARMRRSALLPGEDGMDRHRREVKQVYRKSVASLTKRQKEHVHHADGLALEDTAEGREAFLDHFVEVGAILQFEDQDDEEHHLSRSRELPSSLAKLISDHPDRFQQRGGGMATTTTLTQTAAPRPAQTYKAYLAETGVDEEVFQQHLRNFTADMTPAKRQMVAQHTGLRLDADGSAADLGALMPAPPAAPARARRQKWEGGEVEHASGDCEWQSGDLGRGTSDLDSWSYDEANNIGAGADVQRVQLTSAQMKYDGYPRFSKGACEKMVRKHHPLANGATYIASYVEYNTDYSAVPAPMYDDTHPDADVRAAKGWPGLTTAEVKCTAFKYLTYFCGWWKTEHCKFNGCAGGTPPWSPANKQRRPALCMAEYGLIEGTVKPTTCGMPLDNSGVPIPQTYKQSGVGSDGKSYAAGAQIPYCDKKIQAKSNAKVCRFKQKPDCNVRAGRGSCSSKQVQACTDDKAKCTCSRKKVGNTRFGFGVCQVMVATEYPAATGIAYSERTYECYAEFDMRGALLQQTGDKSCLVASGGPVCPEASTADCFPWGSGGNTDALTHKQCKGFSAYADCRSNFEGRDGRTAGYGWEDYTWDQGGQTWYGNPNVCADEGTVCKGKEVDYKAFKLGIEFCGPLPNQYMMKDPAYGKFYMCRSAMQSVAFSASGDYGKVFGVCTPSIAGSGKLSRDSSCTLQGELSIAGKLDCAVELFGYGIYGGAEVSFGLEIYGGYAQGKFAANVYIAAGSKKDPFLSGKIEVELSEWSFSCCYRRQLRFKAVMAFEVDVWFLPKLEYAAVLYNAKFGTPQPVGCSSEVLAGCDC